MLATLPVLSAKPVEFDGFGAVMAYAEENAADLTSQSGQGIQKKLAQRRRGAEEEQNVDGGSLRIFYLCVPAPLRENDPIPTPKLRHEATGLWIEFPLKEPTQQGKTPVKSSVKSSVKITALMKGTPSISVPDLAANLQITTRGVEKQIALLKKSGTIRRIGPAKGGHWEVLG